MSNLGKALSRIGAESAVHVPWDSLRGALRPLRGQMGICLAEPGIGKSAFSLNWAAKLGGPSLVLSLDTDLGTQAIRLASILSREPMSRVSDNPDVWGDYLDHKAQAIRMYDFTMDVGDLKDVMEAEQEYWGYSPALCIVDNIGNLVREGSYEDYRRAFSELHRVARRYDTFVLALHHVRRNKQAGQIPTMSSGLYSGEQEAEIVIGLYSDPNDTRSLNVNILKNRSGTSRPDGGLYVPLNFDKDTMVIEDISWHHAALRGMAGYA